jgi:predicted nucleic acid-binding protein
VHAYSGTEAILDDLPARHCAVATAIPVRETLGLVLMAKQRGHISATCPVLQQMRKAGMFLSDRVMNQLLGLVEGW